MNATKKDIFFNYPVDFTSTISVGQTSAVSQLVTDSDSVFEITSRQMSIKCGQTPGDILMGDHYPGIYCTIFDTQVGRYLTGGPTPITNIFGTAQYPNILPRPHWMMRKSVLDIQIINNSIYDIASLQLLFSGIKHTVMGE